MNINWTSLVAILGVIAAIVESIRQSQSTKRTIAISVLLELEARFETESMLQKRKNASSSLLSGKNLDTVIDVLNFFELIGLLLRKDALDPQMITSEFNSYAYSYWTASQKYIEQARSEDSTYWINYGKLIKAMNRINDRVYKNSSYLPSENQIRVFLLQESKLKAR
jgi:hypothetical protein